MNTKNYYQVVEIEEGRFQCQLLDLYDQPVGAPFVMDQEELKKYSYCPDHFKNKKSLKEMGVERHVEAGDRHLEQKEFFRANSEYDQALAINKEHLKANWGKGKTLIAQGKRKEAKQVLTKVSSLESLYEKENKHIFNELGIELRRQGMVSEAIKNYWRALSLDPKDEVLYFNLAKAYCGMGDYSKGMEQLKIAISLNPKFKEASSLLSKLQDSLPDAETEDAEAPKPDSD